MGTTTLIFGPSWIAGKKLPMQMAFEIQAVFVHTAYPCQGDAASRLVATFCRHMSTGGLYTTPDCLPTMQTLICLVLFIKSVLLFRNYPFRDLERDYKCVH